MEEEPLPVIAMVDSDSDEEKGMYNELCMNVGVHTILVPWTFLVCSLFFLYNAYNKNCIFTIVDS